MLTLQVL